jgi:3-methyladenine DNA glycosylase AlkD
MHQQLFRASRVNGEVQVEYREILEKLKSQSNSRAVAGMAGYGMSVNNAFGVSIPDLRTMAKQIGKNHSLSKQLWSSGIREARIMASMIADYRMITEQELEEWVSGLDSWEVCDQCCNNLIYKTSFAYQKAMEWSQRPEEFVKRAGFVLMACLAVHDKGADDIKFREFFPIIRNEAADERNLIKKSVNWALRQIGKRNRTMNAEAIKLAADLKQIDSKPARWIACDALRELRNGRIQRRLTD